MFVVNTTNVHRDEVQELTEYLEDTCWDFEVLTGRRRKGIKKAFELLEKIVHQRLYDMIESSATFSKHIQLRAIEVNIADMVEIIYLNDKLVLLDADGYHYDISIIPFEELVDFIDTY